MTIKIKKPVPEVQKTLHIICNDLIGFCGYQLLHPGLEPFHVCEYEYGICKPGGIFNSHKKVHASQFRYTGDHNRWPMYPFL